MTARRLAFLALCLAAGLLLVGTAASLVAPGGIGILDALWLLLLLPLSLYAALGMGNAVIGLGLLLFARDPAAAVLPALRRAPQDPASRTAIAVCLRHEEMAAVAPPLEALMDGLPAAHFDLWFLSDSSAPDAVAAEDAAIAALRARLPGRVHLRRRAKNTGFKAGNVMEFLDHEGQGYDFLLCLDADSVMSAEAVVTLAASMEAAPRIAIIQQLIVGRPVAAVFPRLFQFGMRAGMRSWSVGQGWWQGPEGPYWGHNALIRIAPFREHGRLEPLPDGSAILSHDQVEAVRLHSAGWQVWCLPEERGSLEGNPPALPEFLARDVRWAAGNMQYLALLRQPGLSPMGRWQLLQAILLFLCAPIWAGFFALAAIIAATGGFDGTGTAALLGFFLLFWVMQFSPKLAGYTQVLLQPGQAARYGGRGRFARGAGMELLFWTVLQALRVVHHSGFLIGLAMGRRGAGWGAQNRAERGIGWWDATRLFWPHTLVGVAAFAALALAAPWTIPFALPWAGGLLLAIPFCRATAHPGLAQWLRARGLAATPEEVQAGEVQARSAPGSAAA